MFEKAWKEYYPNIPLEQEAVFKESDSIKTKLAFSFDRYDKEREFSPYEIAHEKHYNRNTTRRIFQEMVAEGTLIRVKRGVYRVA